MRTKTATILAALLAAFTLNTHAADLLGIR
jgi:hypothetical protein